MPGRLAEIVKPTFIEVAPEDTLGEVAERMTARNVGAGRSNRPSACRAC
jgi:hypothetical protein